MLSAPMDSSFPSSVLLDISQWILGRRLEPKMSKTELTPAPSRIASKFNRQQYTQTGNR